MYASIKQTVLILMKYSMLCAWTFPKFWGDRNDQKYLQRTIFDIVWTHLHADQDQNTN